MNRRIDRVEQEFIPTNDENALKELVSADGKTVDVGFVQRMMITYKDEIMMTVAEMNNSNKQKLHNFETKLAGHEVMEKESIC